MSTQSVSKHIKHFISAAIKKAYEATLFVAIVTAVPVSPSPRTATDFFNAPECNINELYVSPFTEHIAPVAKLDKTDCNGVILDDATFSEPIVRDHTDESYGALANSQMRPLGGGEGYQKMVSRPPNETFPGINSFGPIIGVVVQTAAELRSALLAAAQRPQSIYGPQIIYVDDGSVIDLSYCAKIPRPRGCGDPRSGPDDCSEFSLTIPANTILASGRGRGGSRGAILFSRTFAPCAMLLVQGPGVRITGLRIHGPDSSIENDDPIHCISEVFLSGVEVSSATPLHLNTEIDNNEVSSWPGNGIAVFGSMGVRIHHNVIQYNRRQEDNGTCGSDYGLGYGVHVSPGSAIIEANVFDHNSHNITSSGLPGSIYTATYNLSLTGGIGQSFDVHGGDDRKDCTNIAGSWFVIHHNTFLQSSEPAVRIRGVPMTGAWIYKNETHDDDRDHAFNQKLGSGNFSVTDNSMNVDRFPAWFISFGGSSFWQWRQFDAQSMSSVAAGDFDGDGAADVMRSTSTGWQWSRSGRLGWAFLNTNTDPVSQLAFGDFLGDPFTDIIRAKGSEWQISEGGTSSWQSFYPMSMPLSSAAFGDFEGDNHTDAFFANGTQWTIVYGFSPSVIRRHYSEPYKLHELRFGNFVGDSKTDVLRSTGSEWLVWDHASKAWHHLNVSPVPLSQLTLADFNGDGLTDIARSKDGKWIVSWAGKSLWQTLNNASNLELRSQLIGDFNGDHKADVLSAQSPDP